MPGQAVLTIGQKSWEVYLATTPDELTQGLAGLSSIPEGTGMFFDTGADQLIQVTTENMQFPIDIAFISSDMRVVDIIQSFQPGHRIIASAPARYFLEVNAGELAGINRGDTVSVNVVQAAQQQLDMNTIFNLMMQMMMLIFMFKVMMSMIREPKKKVSTARGTRRALPPGYKRLGGRKLLVERSAQTETKHSDIEEKWYKKGFEAGKTDYWMTLEETLDEAMNTYIWRPRDAESLVGLAKDMWEETDYFNAKYGLDMMHDAEDALESRKGMSDYGLDVGTLYLELESQFWQGYIQGRKAIGIDIYQKAEKLMSGRQPQTYMPQTKRQDVVELPFAGAVGRQMWWVASYDSKTVTVQVTGARRLSDRELEGAFADSVAIINKEAIGHKGLQFAMAKEGTLQWLDLADSKLVGVKVVGAKWLTSGRLEDAFSKSTAIVEGVSPEYLPKTGGLRLMPKLPKEAYNDILFREYIRDLVKMGEDITDDEARMMWNAWQESRREHIGYSPQTKATVYCPICGKEIEVPRYDSITRTEALREHIQAEHRQERQRQTKYMPETKETTNLGKLRIVKAYKEISRHGENQIVVTVQAWGIFPRGRRPHLLDMHRRGNVYVIRPLYTHVSEPVEVPADKVEQWIRSLPIRYFSPIDVAPEKKQEAEKLASRVDQLVDIVALGEGPQPQTTPRLTREDVTVDAWQERDRLGIWVTNKHTGETVAEWWDEDARQMFEDGFFEPGVPQRSGEALGRTFVNSVLDYLEDMGALAKAEEGPAAPERAGNFHLREDRMGNIILEYSEERGKDVLLQFEAEKAVVYDILTEHEEKELNAGWEVRVAARDARASVLEELWQYAEPKQSAQTKRTKQKRSPQTKKAAVTPKEGRRQRRDSGIEYYADSPEFLTQTVDLTGYRDKISQTFQEAIKRAKRGKRK